MNDLMNRVIITLFLGMCIYQTENEKTIYVILFAIIYTSLDYYFEKTSYEVIADLIYAIAICFSSLFILAFPLVSYRYASDFKEKISRRKIGVLSVIGGLVIMWTIQDGARLVNKDNTFMIILEMAINILAIYLSRLTKKYEMLYEFNLKMKDDNEEYVLLVKQKNDLQRQKQNDEISMATLRERNRIAREIHDNVGHLLTRSILQMGALQAIYKEEPLNSSLKEVSETLNESMKNVRQSVHDLHNESVDLRKQVEDLIMKNEDFTIHFEYDMDENVKREIKYAFIAIVSESFENARKHSNATDIWIEFHEHPGFYQYIFKDNGTNIKVKENGIGLHNMQSRIDEFGGNIDFNTDGGFKIFAIIPK